MKKNYSYFVILIASLTLLGCASKKAVTPHYPWFDQSPILWKQPIRDLKKDSKIPLPRGFLIDENIGESERVNEMFDRWTFNERMKDRVFVNWAEVSEECKGNVDLEFALTPYQWKFDGQKLRYYLKTEKMIEKIAVKLIKDFGNVLEGKEKELFVRALKTVFWQESLWQHYYRYKNWFFILLGKNSFNRMGDWGIGQIARSYYKTGEPLSKPFFDSKGHCSIASTIYYGALIYYFNYLEARKAKCNGSSTINQIIGAYTAYSSGYEPCFWKIENKPGEFQDYQIRAIGDFMTTFVTEPWKEKISYLKKRLRK